MTQMSDEPFDKRTTPYRDGVTDQAHEGLIRAKTYVVGEILSCYAATAPVLAQPEPGAEQLDQLLLGERFKIIERKHDYYWGQALRDGYVGYVPVSAFRRDWYLPTHYVATLRTYVFAAPNLKASIQQALSLNALVSVSRHENGFAYINDMGWVFDSHLSDFERFADDFVAVAESYINAPYQWGGRESIGLDCSGLLQQALYAAGYGCPRDSDMQASLGVALIPGQNMQNLRRGDLVFWKGHVAIMVDDSHIIHANAHHMKVAIEPLHTAIARISAAGAGQPTGFRRL
ncbi:NlpC/P60 family protein [Asticcacaulis sp. EMRT-3]|uniref:C40 family peptidase n=1 Tax=Asticcacaulis sp. EMRT-3 TaxID=3040349 RepID=UPI0024AEF0AD|nr:NlpC/P60 family protein [Asticcacaulis sp. EMRT-3]MDI7775438.1 NlpC/P60 family protein [Asticcacaulis sp. EMRT-3]